MKITIELEDADLVKMDKLSLMENSNGIFPFSTLADIFRAGLDVRLAYLTDDHRSGK